ncbi:uncharacterized protein [Ptychodera flava]|uniref:uncharacterized protein isoform X2 n=1 Tax=Ptychodera flava TaxID=63121 RepID=UPI003969FAFD
MTMRQNNGTSTVKNNTIYCDCQPGYSGLLCESNITTVLTQPTKKTTAVITRFTRPDQPRVSPSPSSLSNPPSTNTRPGVSPTTLDARSTQTRAFDKSMGDKSQASIIGGSVAVAMVLLIIAVIAVFVICRKRSKAPGRKNTNNEMTKFNNLSYEDVLEIKEYQVTNDKQGTDVFPGNSGNDVYYSSIDDKKIARDGGIVDKASYKTSNDTDERAAFKIGFVENVAYEESMAQNEIDNMKEGFVDNVAYEASIDPDKGNTGGGFVDNVMYEATIDPDQRAGAGAKDGSSFVDNVAYKTSTEQEERDNVEDGFVDNVAYKISMDRKERNRPSEGLVEHVAYPPATGRDDGHSSTDGFVDNIVYESSIGNDEESTTAEGVCNNAGEAASMNKDHGNRSENGIVENVVYESAENDENNYEEI